MPLITNEKEIDQITLELIKNKISSTVNRYIEYVLKQKDINLIFLKSMIHVEELLKDINEYIYGKRNKEMLGKNIGLVSILKDDYLNKSIKLLEKIKETRNNLTHSLEYDITTDQEFIKIIKKYYIDNNKDNEFDLDILEISNEKSLLSNDTLSKLMSFYFKDVIHGFLYVKLGIEHIENFIEYKK